MKILATIEDCPVIVDSDGKVHFVAKLAIDNDGSNNRQHDPDWQPDTSLHYRGHPIDSESVPGIVAPPAIIQGVPGIVLGCKARVTYNGLSCDAVVFDIGPKKKLGEGTPALARKLNIDPSPTHGGIDEHVVYFEIWPGIPAYVNGIPYPLQHS